MATRSVIAISKGDGWEGLYIHNSGYPTAIGPELWEVLRECSFAQDTFEIQFLTAHPGGYSSFPSQCYCHAMGEQDSDGRYTAASEEDNAALFIEYVYIVGRRVLTILVSVKSQGSLTHDNGVYQWEEPRYRWARLGAYRLEPTEPDWADIETQADQLREEVARVIGDERAA